MNAIRFDDPCILFALRRESGPFCRALRAQQRFPGAPCEAWYCGPASASVLVVETGVGRQNVSRVLDWLLAKPQFEGVPYEPSFLVFAGFAGALTDDLHVGDVVVADEVVDGSGHSWRTTWPCDAAAHRRGRLVTVNELTATPDAKRRLAQEHGACVVDMESASFAERCTQAGRPFGCVRAVSDEAATALSPALLTLLSGGTASPWRVLLALLRRPALLPELLRLARDTRTASRRLDAALRSLLNPTFRV